MNAKDFFDELARRTQRAPKEPDPPHVTVPASLVRSAKLASWIAFFALVYFLFLYTLDIARDRAADLHLTKAGAWTGDIQFWFPYVAGFAAVAVGIPYVAKIAIPVFMSLTWRENLWPKLWALVIAMAVSLVVIAGTFAVQGDALMERDRVGVVAEEARAAGVTALRSQLAAVEADLDEMTNAAAGNRLTAQAARAGVEGWKVAIAEAEKSNAPLMPQRRAAMGSAVAADDLRRQRRELIAKIAAAPTAASVANRVETKATGWIGATMNWLEGVRAILLSLVMDIVCLLMPWIAQRLEQARARQLAGIADSIVRPQSAAWADESHMVRDMREEPKLKAAPMDAGYQGDLIHDEQGNELAWVEGYVNKRGKWIPGHYRKTGKKAEITVKDEPGVVLESDSRAARSAVVSADEDREAPQNSGSSSAAVRAGFGGSDTLDRSEQDTLSEPATEDDWAALLGDPIPAEELKGAEVYDAPVGPQRGVALGKRGDQGVMQAAE
ncbi:MAG: hypothetical protein EBR82_65755 [Caulobacteraceae bacterium]|nr:hypothetical protein [Caulobacteraceae bacterium]